MKIISKYPSGTAEQRCDNTLQTTRNRVMRSSSALYESKWKYFCTFFKDENLQEGNGVIDVENKSEPSGGIVGKLVEYFN